MLMANFRTFFTALPPAKRRLATAMLCVALCVNLTAVFSPSALANSAVGLGLAEQQLAGKLASNQAWQQQRNSLNTNPHTLGIQTLSIELDERKKGEHSRRARVYQFNYQLKQSRLVLVDLENGIIMQQQVIDSVHLPLNEEEIATARRLVEQQTDIMEKLNKSQTRRGLSHLTDLSAIELKASIFEPDNQQHDCATQRCALISLFDQTRTVFSVEPLVNLQSLSVSTLEQSY